MSSVAELQNQPDVSSRRALAAVTLLEITVR